MLMPTPLSPLHPPYTRSMHCHPRLPTPCFPLPRAAPINAAQAIAKALSQAGATPAQTAGVTGAVTQAVQQGNATTAAAVAQAFVQVRG